MTVTKYFAATSGKTYYAKPTPIVASPWAGDVVTSTESGTTGIFSLSVNPGTSYFIYERLGGAPASTDDIEGEISALTTSSSSTIITSLSPQIASGTNLITLSDMVNALLDRCMAPEGDTRTIRLLSSAVQQAMRDLPKRNKWHYYKTLLRFQSSPQVTVDVSYVESTRRMTITSDDTWPSDVIMGEVTYNNVPYPVISRISDTVIELDPTVTIGADYEGSIAWSRNRYTFNKLFHKVEYLINLNTRLPVVYMEPASFYEQQRLIRFAGRPSLFTFRGSATAGFTDIVLNPPSLEQYQFESLVTYAPRIPKIYQARGTDASMTEGSNIVNSAAGVFKPGCVGEVFRLYESEDDIPFGTPTFECFIESRTNDNTITLATAAPATTTSGVYVVSSYIDIEPSLMNTMVENLAYANYCQNHDHKGLAQAEAISRKTLLEAIAADVKIDFSTQRDIGWQLLWSRPYEYAQVLGPNSPT